VTCDEIIRTLNSLANPANVAGMARFGINPDRTLGVTVADLRRIAREAGRDHSLAAELWASGIHEARLMATLVDRADQVTEDQMETWAGEFDSWDICDLCCNNLFRATPYAYDKARGWSERDGQFVKRAGFVLMATLSVHDKKAGDHVFAGFLRLIEREAGDERNFVKKAVNWALRQIGKRNRKLNEAAIGTALRIRYQGSKPARWIAADALRELQNPKILAKLKS
jgi:3-methyladenine DNA glycosylase AlkD